MKEQKKAIAAAAATLLSVLIAYAVAGTLDEAGLTAALQALASAGVAYGVTWWVSNEPPSE